MSGTLTVTLRAPLAADVELDMLAPDRCAGLAPAEIAALPLWVGREQCAVGDLFDVHAAGGDDGAPDGGYAVLRIEGDLSRAHRVGAGMTGGELHVQGDVGHDAGVGLGGGVLRIHGNAGDRLGGASPGASKGITGGEIVVAGSAGRDVAARARRGLVVVGGSLGEDAARAMIAGTLIVFGAVGANPGRGSKRGSVIASGGIDVPATYRYACTYEPPHVRMVLTYLNRRYGLAVADRIVAGRFRRYCGDAGEPGKGEILVLDESP